MPNREIPEMTPEQEDRLRRRIRELDARNNAYFHILENPIANEQVQAEVLDELRHLRELAREDVDYLKREYGFPGY